MYILDHRTEPMGKWPNKERERRTWENDNESDLNPGGGKTTEHGCQVAESDAASLSFRLRTTEVRTAI